MQIKTITDNFLGNKVKIYFGEKDQRFPQMGTIVKSDDFEYLSSKGMFRFLNHSKEHEFNGSTYSMNILSKIYRASDITQIVNV